jgi:prepilin-type N-terminal cleavage/methylation domain-containing protein
MINMTQQLLSEKNKKAGFTLIEMLIVVFILSILALMTALSLQPALQRSKARNVTRKIDLTNLSTAFYEYILDNDVNVPPGITTTERQIGKCTTGGDEFCQNADSTCLNLESEMEKYLKIIPFDPEHGNETTTGYSVVRDENNIITIKACLSELNETIEFSR